ncbi:MAG: hypothetical protein GX557_05415 [Chloroflexi bacterium]|nr:hypothetical protein [Chloroflexota bacterium]
MSDDVTPDGERVERRVACEVYSRIVGYITPVGQWNRGKQQEQRDRKVYRVEDDERPNVDR